VPLYFLSFSNYAEIKKLITETFAVLQSEENISGIREIHRPWQDSLSLESVQVLGAYY
jgi:hypothetical protein